MNAIVLVAVMRQVGVLHQRVRPSGAGEFEGPDVGTVLEALPFEPVGDAVWEVPFRHELTVMGYVSPGCGLCEELAQMMAAFRRAQPSDVQTVLATEAAPAAAWEWYSKNGARMPFARLDGVFSRHFVPASPFAVVWLRQDGAHVKALARGVVNTLEQLEDLVHAAIANRRGMELERTSSVEVAYHNGGGSASDAPSISSHLQPTARKD
jgi:hypothetical protein